MHSMSFFVVLEAYGFPNVVIGKLLCLAKDNFLNI